MGASCCSSVEKGNSKDGSVATGSPKGDTRVRFSHKFAQYNDGKLDEHYDMTKTKLGEGAFAGVYLATHKSSKVERAVKSVDAKGLDSAQLPAEVDIQQSLDHPHIVKVHETFRDAKCVYLVMEVCTGGELLEKIKNQSDNMRHTEHRSATFVMQIMSAIKYLHVTKVVHRDIKPDNILLHDKTDDAQVKVIDFGLAAICDGKKPLTTKVGNPYHTAPEVQSGRYDQQCDIWSCGAFIWIMLSGYPPFSGDDTKEVLKAVAAGQLSFPETSWCHVSKDAKDLLSSMLSKDPTKRPSADAVLSHEWMKRGDPSGKQPLPSIVKKLHAFDESSKLKKVCLTLIATQIDYKDINGLAAYFKSMDVDGNGKISKEELKKGLEKQVASFNGKVPADFAKLMAIDSDGDGSIDYTEFISGVIDKQTYLQRDVLWAAFRTCDADGNGKIEAKELRQLLEGKVGNVGAAIPEDKLKSMIAEADQNGDGLIDFDEFMAMMKQ